jgi:serine/threonine protein phosphatase PrpC
LQVIEDHGIARVALKKEFGNDMLATSRGFGDFEFKDNADWDDEHQAIIAKPDVVVHERTEADCFLVLACDGIFDVMTNDDVGKYVMSRFQSGLQAEEDFLLVKTADGLLRECLDLQSQDNMSVILVALNDMAKRLLETQSLPQTQLDHAFASGSSTVVVDNK